MTTTTLEETTPEPEETTTAPETEAPVETTEAPAPVETEPAVTEAPATEHEVTEILVEKKGCGSMIAGAVAVIALLGTAIVFKKKD